MLNDLLGLSSVWLGTVPRWIPNFCCRVPYPTLPVPEKSGEDVLEVANTSDEA